MFFKECAMFCVYAVRVIDSQKHRYYIGVYESLDEAKHIANCYTLGNASYAYVKDTTGGTVFLIRSPEYAEEPLDPSRQVRRLQPYPAA